MTHTAGATQAALVVHVALHGTQWPPVQKWAAPQSLSSVQLGGMHAPRPLHRCDDGHLFWGSTAPTGTSEHTPPAAGKRHDWHTPSHG